MIIQQLRSSPKMIVCLAAFFTGATLLVIGSFQAKTVDPQVTMEFDQGPTTKQLSTGRTAIATMMDGEHEDGPALIVRVPDELSDKGEAKLFIAGSLSDVKIPAPFAPSAEVIALGWSPETLRSLK